MDRRLDPRSIVTPYAFAVHPDLLGRPLATPWQRLGAILVDLVVIGFISQIGLTPLAICSTVLLFWLAFRRPEKVVFGKVFRIAVGRLGFLVLTATVLLVLWFRYGDFFQDPARESGVEVQVETGEPARTGEVSESEEGAVGLGDVVQGLRGVVEIRNTDTREEAQPLMDVFVQGAFDSGLSRGQIRDLLGSFIPEDATWARDSDDMVDQAMGTLGVSEAQADDNPPVEGEADPEEPSVALGPAATDSIDSLNRVIQLAQEELADTVAALEAERNRRALSWFWEIIDDLSVGSLWGALYFTITLAWWGGTSVGKRLFRIRVVMIDKRPLNWWLSFERVGGYAAGFATGLLGFAQIFWDPNRQAIHDKVSETFVIQDGRDPVPGPWIEEGNTQWTRGRHETQETPGV